MFTSLPFVTAPLYLDNKFSTEHVVKKLVFQLYLDIVGIGN